MNKHLPSALGAADLEALSQVMSEAGAFPARASSWRGSGLYNRTPSPSEAPVVPQRSDSREPEDPDAAAKAADALEHQHLQRLIEAGINLSSERDHDRLVEKILLEAKSLTNADGGTLYLRSEDERTLVFKIVRNDSLGIMLGGTTGKEIPFPPLSIYDPETGEPNYHNVCTASALDGRTINIPDAYQAEEYDFAGTKRFDETTGYRSQSFLTIPLRNHKNEVMGVLQLINARTEKGEVIAFELQLQKMIEALASQAAIALDNQVLIAAQQALLDSMVKVLASAIDAKSPYTSGHCERVPALAKMIAEKMCAVQEGPFAQFDLGEEEWYELHVAAYLHDCGKVTTPEYVMDKPTKLEVINNRIHEIRTRFEVLRRDAEIAYWKGVAEGATPEPELKAAFEDTCKALDDEFAFVAECNIGGEFMRDELKDRVCEIGKRTFTRYFDRSLGLSWEETKRLENNPPPPAPVVETLLQDREDHKTDRYNFGEAYNLCITRGTISDEERRTINDHIVETQKMLEEMPFPKNLKRVPAIAGNHHEKMDGSGYPNGILGKDMGDLERMMAIADVFEALTAADRPYKTPKTLTESIRILSFMVKDGHLDPDIYDLFLRSGVYQDYADTFLLPEQMDEVDLDSFLGIRPKVDPPWQTAEADA